MHMIYDHDMKHLLGTVTFKGVPTVTYVDTILYSRILWIRRQWKEARAEAEED